jgi:hypothetical protein
VGFAQKPSLTLKAYKRFHVSGRAPAVVAETGEKAVVKKPEPTYLLYLVANKLPYLRIDRIWINHELYLGKMEKITVKPVISETAFRKDTLVRNTDETVWQIVITGKPESNFKPRKDVETLVAKNEIVLRLYDKKGVLFTRTTKTIKLLESSGGQ